MIYRFEGKWHSTFCIKRENVADFLSSHRAFWSTPRILLVIQIPSFPYLFRPVGLGGTLGLNLSHSNSVHLRGCPKPLANLWLRIDHSWLFCSVADNLHRVGPFYLVSKLDNWKCPWRFRGSRWPASRWFCTASLIFVLVPSSVVWVDTLYWINCPCWYGVFCSCRVAFISAVVKVSNCAFSWSESSLPTDISGKGSYCVVWGPSVVTAFAKMSFVARIRKWLESCERLFPIHPYRFISDIENTHWNSPFLFHHFQRNSNRGYQETRSLLELFCTFHISICINLCVFSFDFTAHKSFFKWLNITILRNRDVITLW